MADIPDPDDRRLFPLLLRGTEPDEEEAHTRRSGVRAGALATEASPCYDYAFVAGVGTAILRACTVT